MKPITKQFISELKSIDEKESTLTAFISTNAVDRMGEILDPKGVDLSAYRKNPVVLWAHDYHQPPIGKAVWVKRDGEGIVSKVKFANTPFAKDIFNLYKEKFLNAFSVGFVPKEWDDADNDDKKKKKASRIYKKWEMLEYSAVPVPANPEALALAMKKGLVQSEELKKALSEPLQEFNNEIEEEIREEKKEVEPEETKEKDFDLPTTDDLIIELETLKAQLIEKDNEIIKLKYDLYKIYEEQQKKFSEITAKNLANEVGEEVRRVIRKMQGRLD